MSTEVADLFILLQIQDGQLIAATKREATALEDVAVTAENTKARQTKATTAAGAAEEAEAAKSKRRLATLGSSWAVFGKNIDEAAAKQQKAFGRVTELGKMSAIALGVAAVASVKMGEDFQAEMELVHTQAGASQQEVDRLSKSVLDLAPTVGIGPEKLAEGLYHVESAGFRGQQAVEILAAAARDAAIGMGDMESVSQGLIGTMAVGLKDVKNAADAAAYLNQIVGIGDMRMEKLSAAISTGVLPSFKSAGLGMTDFGAALATLTDNVTPADEAATRLRMTVALMSAPSDKAASALERIGMTSTRMAEDMRKPNGLLVAVMDLKKHLEASGLSAVEQQQVIEHAFGGGRTSGAILTLIEESDRLKSKYDELGTSASRQQKLQDAWTSTQGTFKQKLHELGAALEKVGIQAGLKMLPPLTHLFDFLSKHTTVLKVVAGIIGIVLVAAIGAYTIAMAQAAIATIAATWPILLIIAAVALVAIGVYELIKHWKTVWSFIKKIAADVWHWIVHAWKDTWKAVLTAWHWAENTIFRPIGKALDTVVVKPIKAYLHVLTTIWKVAWGFLSVVFHDAAKVWKVVWHTIEGTAMAAWNNTIKPVFDFIDKYGIKPTREAFNWLGKEWDRIWKGIKAGFSAVWNNDVKPVFDAVQRDAIHPVHDALTWLGNEWDRVWKGITSGFSNVWNRDLKPIFDAIKHAYDDVKNALSFVSNHPGQVGSMFAHILGFDEGGWVPGPVGAPQLAVVHGGEYVLNTDTTKSIRSGGSVRVGSPSPAAVTAAGGGGTVVHNHVYINGKPVYDAIVAQSQRTKKRSGTTFLD